MEQEEEQLREYISETLRYIQIVKTFCDSEQKWTLQRNEELKKMRDIKIRAGKLFGRFRKKKLEKKLGAVLKNTLVGLKELQHFLDAVEKLAVTSPSVFIDEIVLLNGVNNEHVQLVISIARDVAPLLIHFKRDDAAFFLPWLDNVEVLAFQLDKYIHITQDLCKKIKSKSALENIDIQEKISPTSASLIFSFNMSRSLKDMVDHLSRIRLDESFRMSFLFSKQVQRFIETYSECRSRMFRFLSDLEKTAVELDKMKKGSGISAVAGSSVAAVGGVFSIVGLALAPVTAGVSLGLTLTGVVLGVTSAANSLVTGVTEMAVNKRHGVNANNIFQRFMEDTQKVQDCLEQIGSPLTQLDEGDIALGAGKVINSAVTVGKRINDLVDGASAVETLSSAANVGLQEANAARNIPNLAADLPDIGWLAKGTPLAMTKAARVGFIALNALFIGLDLALICKESVSLAKGEKSESSQLIRHRSALWCSELKAWDKIRDCLRKGSKTFQEDLAILDQSFTISGMIKFQ